MVQGRGALYVVGRYGPVIGKGSAPDAKIQDLHDDICDEDIDGGAFDNEGLA